MSNLYDGHPQLVENDGRGLPMMEKGKFYKHIRSSHHSSSYINDVCERRKPILFLGRSSDTSRCCYPCLSESQFNDGFPYFGYHCYWYTEQYHDRRVNYVLELVPEEQEIFKRFHDRLSAGRNHYAFSGKRRLVRSLPNGKPNLKDFEVYYVANCGRLSVGYYIGYRTKDSYVLSKLEWYRIGGHNFAGEYVHFNDGYEIYEVPTWVRHAYFKLYHDLRKANTPHKLTWKYQGIWAPKETS